MSEPAAVHSPGDTAASPPDVADGHSATRENAEPEARIRTGRRAQNRRKAAPLAKIGMILFAIGLVAILADFALFASGSRNLPLWINLVCLLAPIGFGLGLIGVLVENRRSSPALVARRAARG